MADFHRRVYGTQVWVGFAFNHESALRTVDFFTKKVCQHAVRQKNDPSYPSLKVGNIYFERDWGAV